MSTNTPPPVGAFMKGGDLRAKVLGSSPESLVVRDGSGRFYALRHHNGVWSDNNGDVWKTVKPEPVEFSARRSHHGTWWAVEMKEECVVAVEVEGLPDHMDAGAVARAIAGLLTDMANGVQS